MNLFHFIAKLNFTAQSEASQGLEAISDIVLNSENLFQIADNDHWKSATVSEVWQSVFKGSRESGVCLI